MTESAWRSESDEPAPERLGQADDRITAVTALRRVRRGEHLLYTGDFHNAKQLLGAMGRRLPGPPPARSQAGFFGAKNPTNSILFMEAS